MKPQFVDKLAKQVKDNTTVQMLLDRKDQTDTQKWVSASRKIYSLFVQLLRQNARFRAFARASS